MEMKSISDCLNFFELMILCKKEKYAGIGNLEDVREYMIRIYNDKNIEEMVDILAIFSKSI